MSDYYSGHKSSKIAEIEWFWQSVHGTSGRGRLNFSTFPPLLHVALAASNANKSFYLVQSY